MEPEQEIYPDKTIPSCRKKTTCLSILLIIALGFAVYSNSLSGEFIWDDEFLIEDNVHIKNPSHISKIFTQNIGAGAGDRYAFYRPLQIVTYMIDYSLWNLNAKGYHLTNILLHILTALSVFWLIYTIFKDALLSFLTGCFFVVHPIHTEAITYIAGRADALSLLFMLLCTIFYIKSSLSKNIGIYILMLLSYTLALLSKENSLILPVLLLLYSYSFEEKLKIKKLVPLVSLAFIYVLLRVTVFKTMLPDTSSSMTLFQRLPGFFVAITSYIRLLFFPFNLHMEYGLELFHWGDFKAILGVLLSFALLTYAFKNRKSNKLVFFSITWFFIALFPVSNIFPINAYMAEHWLYLPSIGFFLILAQILCLLYQNKHIRIFIIALIPILFGAYSYLTIRQNDYWNNPIDFYKRTLKYAPNSSRAYNNLGNIYKDANKKEEAVASYKKAIEIKADYAEAHNNLGVMYADMDMGEKAIRSYKKAIEIKGDYAEPYNNLGNVYRTINKYKESIVLYEKALEIKPDYAEVYNNLGIAYAAINKKESAVASYKRALEMNPGYAEMYNNLGIEYAALNRREEAVAAYKKAIEMNADYAEAYNNLGVLYDTMNRKKEAVASYMSAIEIKADFAEPYFNLGNTYQALKNTEEAIASYKKAIEIKADYADAYHNLGVVYSNLNRIEEALPLYKKTIEISPRHADAYNNLSAIYIRKKQYSVAIEYCDKAKALGLVNTDFLKILEPYR